MRIGSFFLVLQVIDVLWYSLMCEFLGGGENFNFFEIGKNKKIFYFGLILVWLEFSFIIQNIIVMNLICIKKKWLELF